MHWTRRDFLRSCLTGAAVLSLSKKEFASILPLHHEGGDGVSDGMLLDELQRASFDFFWSEADPKSGLVRDRALPMAAIRAG